MEWSIDPPVPKICVLAPLEKENIYMMIMIIHEVGFKMICQGPG